MDIWASGVVLSVHSLLVPFTGNIKFIERSFAPLSVRVVSHFQKKNSNTGDRLVVMFCTILVIFEYLMYCYRMKVVMMSSTQMERRKMKRKVMMMMLHKVS